jgi:pimeloyl-ACP methyl ester carboxylesterase
VVFAVAGFSRAVTLGIAGHTERAVLETGGLAPLGRTSDGATIVGVVLAGIGLTLGWRWLRSLEDLTRAIRDGDALEQRRAILRPSATGAMRGLLGAEDGRFRWVARLVALMAIAALACGIAAVVLARMPGEPRVALVLALDVIGAGLAVVACGLATWLVDRLEEAATDADSPFARPISARRHGLRALPIVALLGVLLYAPLALSVSTVHEQIDCPGLPGGKCRRVTVALDQDHPENGQTLSVIYRVVPASGQRLGTLLVLTGGPGVRGLSEADPRLASIDPTVLARFDLVFFDQRGVGGSGGLDCTDAVREEQSRLEENGLTVSFDFVRACQAELGADVQRLPYLSTAQAAEDIDAIRAALGIDRIVVYGESYGTRLAQAYARLHPDHLAGLILDGAIDPAVAPLDFWQTSAAGFESTLHQTLDECNRTDACRADVAGGDAVAAFDDELANLRRGPVTLVYPDGFGEGSLAISAADAIGAIGRALYRQGSRMEVQRAVAAASHGDWLLLYRLVVVALPEPVIGQAHLSPWTPTSYYAIECADVDARRLGGLDAFDAAVAEAASKAGPFAGLVYQDAPCLDWPAPVHAPSVGVTAAAEASRAATPLPAAVPTLVLAATADPITPISNAEGIVARSPGAPLVMTDGGRHVSLWDGDACVDGIARTFLLDGRLPPTNTHCPGSIATDYVKLLPAKASGFASDKAAIEAVAHEFEALPEVTDWDGLGTIIIGCPAGGDVRFYGFPGEINLLVSRCAFVPGLTLDGDGSMDPASRAVSLRVTRVP